MKKNNQPDISRKMQHASLIDNLVENLTLSELNTLLMEVFRHKSQRMKPSMIFDSYRNNRFVKPSSLDPMKLLKLRLDIMEMALSWKFVPAELSPLTPLGTCSTIAPVDQNNIVTALRGTEAVSDPTNVLALEASLRRKEHPGEEVNLCCMHRAVRAQSFDNPNFSAHFEVFCMVSAGKDRGNFTFEKDMLLKHINFYLELLKKLNTDLNLSVLLISFLDKEGGNHSFTAVANEVKESIVACPVEISEAKTKFSYYKSLRFNILLHKNDEEHLIVDGGYTDWSRQLLNNKKERLLTGGLGVEYLMKIME